MERREILEPQPLIAVCRVETVEIGQYQIRYHQIEADADECQCDEQAGQGKLARAMLTE